MRKPSLRVVAHVLVFSCLFALTTLDCGKVSGAVIFTNAVTIAEGDLTYDGQDIVISNTTVSINGSHSFNSILLTSNAVLNHSTCTASQTHELNLNVSNQVVVDGSSRIDVSGLGYLPGRTTGNTTMGGATGASGGSYGGLGSVGGAGGTVNAIYGDYTANNLNEYVSVGATNYTFDADGNLTQEVSPNETTTYQYNDENRLVALTSPQGDWQYTYDALENRTVTTVNGTATRGVIDPMGLGNLVGEYDAVGNLLANYNYGAEQNFTSQP
jgi:YD repeat-containing protein